MADRFGEGDDVLTIVRASHKLGPSVAAFLCVVLQSGWAQAVRLKPGHPDPSGQARVVAVAELQRLSYTGGRWFGGMDPAILRDASVGEPFFLFWTDEAFLDFAAVDSDNILQFVNRYNLSFPIFRDNRPIGAINLKETNGGFVASSVQMGEGHYGQLAELQRVLPLGHDRRLSVLTTRFGNFFIVEDGVSIFKMAPLVGMGTEAPETTGLPTFRPTTDYVPMLKQAIREFQINRKRSLSQADTVRLEPLEQ